MMDMFISQFHFLRPWAWLCLILLFYIIYIMKKNVNLDGSWQKICTPELYDYLQTGSDTGKVFHMPMWLVGISGLLAITALAGPAWEQQPQPMYREASGLVIALDLSRSMDAADIKPSRLVRAKQKLSDLLAMRKEGQTALLAFAGTAYVVTPLTEDRQTILAQLPALTTDIMPKQGGDLDDAMEKALDLFKQASIKHGQILFLTDSHYFSKQEIQKVRDAGHEISVIGLGTSQGAPIPQVNGNFVIDGNGNIVIPKLDRERLQNLASVGEGTYHDLSLDNSDIIPILTRLRGSILDHYQADKIVKSVIQHDSWYEEGPWLLLALVPMALLGFRRGLLMVVLCFSMQVKPVEASDWGSMWHTPNKQAEALMSVKEYKQAATTFQNLSWKMAAHYRDKNYQAALDDFQRIKQPSNTDLYNKANTLAQLGRLDEAIKAYANLIKENPDNQDAKANKTLLEKMKKKQKKKSKQDKKKQNQKKQGKQSQEQKNQDKQKQGTQSQDKQTQEQQKQNQQNQNKQEQDKQNQTEQSQDKQKQAKQSPKEQKQHPMTEKEIKELEEKQAFKQTLRRVPDDPSGLLRRKFLYQYQQQNGESVSQDGEAW